MIDDATVTVAVTAVGVKRGSPYDASAYRGRHSSGVESSQEGLCGAVRRYVVIGGGIAGVSCAQELQRLLYASPCCRGEDSLGAADKKSIDIVLISLTDHLTEVRL